MSLVPVWPFTLINGQPADATQVMADLNALSNAGFSLTQSGQAVSGNNTFSGNNIFSGNQTFSGTNPIGGSTWTGNATFSGNNIFTGITVLTAIATIAALRLYSGTALGQTVFLQGYTAQNDGAQGPFQWGAYATDNGGTIITPTGQSVGSWYRIYEGGINPQWFGAKFDGVTDDHVANQAALILSSGKSFYIPSGVSLNSVELLYDMDTYGPLEITGSGPTSILQSSGSTNAVLHISGTSGVTSKPLILKDFSLNCGTSGTGTACLHLDGIALYWVRNLSINGNSKVTNGIQCTAAQQGEISGCEILACTNSILLEAGTLSSSRVGSNGIEIHGNSFIGSVSTISHLLVSNNAYGAGADDGFFHSNHLTSGSQQIDLYIGVGQYVVAQNHLEPTTGNNAVIVRDGYSCIHSNSFYCFSGQNAVQLAMTSYGAFVFGNLISGNILIDSGVINAVFAFNYQGGIYTDNGTGTVNIGNYNYSGTGALTTSLQTGLKITSPAATAGDIATFNPNPVVAGNWGFTVNSAGAADAYMRLHDVAISGQTSGGILKFMSGVGGTVWAQMNATNTQLNNSLLLTAAASTAGAGQISVGSTTATTATAGTAALPTNPVGFMIINIAGTNYKIPYYAS